MALRTSIVRLTEAIGSSLERAYSETVAGEEPPTMNVARR